MEQISKQSFKALSDMTSVIAERFFLARRIRDIKNGDYLAEVDIDGDAYNQYLEKVNKAFSVLNESEKNLINNEFFFQSYHNWWEPIYSKATFYRYKKQAMMKFLGAFYYD